MERRVSITKLKAMKKRGERFAKLTAYDYPSARLVEDAVSGLYERGKEEMENIGVCVMSAAELEEAIVGAAEVSHI